MSARTVAQLKIDVQEDHLPQVSWLLPPAAYSEHPNYTPLYGAAYMAGILDALTSNPEVWSKTALFIMYDENDGLFDHIVPPQPPTVPGSGLSTVAIDLERHDFVSRSQAGEYTADNLPYGLGPRVPMMVVSPWTKGGFVCSQVFDHTSVLQFIEKRFGVRETNITGWRRAICGDLTSAFDFAKGDVQLPTLPDTSAYVLLADAQCRRPQMQSAPSADIPFAAFGQEPGARPARPLPYELIVNGKIERTHAQGFSYAIGFENTGRQGAHFWVYSGDPAVAPRSYTVEAGKRLDDIWAISTTQPYQLSVYGPNGFFRRFSGTRAAIGLQTSARYELSNRKTHLVVRLQNLGKLPIRVHVSDQAYGAGMRTHKLAPGTSLDDPWDLSGQANWYDLRVSCDSANCSQWRFAGHVENNFASSSDPAAVAPVLAGI